MKINTPEENRLVRAKEGRAQEQRTALLQEISEKLGYTEVASFDDLQLTPDEIQKLSYAKNHGNWGENAHYLIAKRADEALVRVIVCVRRTLGGAEYTADIFSPAYPDGHGANHDYNRGEFERSLHVALNAKPYTT